MKRERRKIKLINPNLQLRIVGIFAGASALSFLLQGLFIASRLSEQRVATGNDAGYSGNIWVEVIFLSFGLFLPLTIAVGILLTHRIAGPVYRMEKHLQAILRGENQGSCRLRKDDEFQELCGLINQTVDFLRAPLEEDEFLGDEESAENQRRDLRAIG